MREQKFNKDWKFWIDENSFALVWNIQKNAENVTVPHDAMMQKPAYEGSRNRGNTGFRDGEIYTYVKMLYAPEEYKERTVMLKFEGVYMNAFIYINGQLAGKNPFGYTTFYVSLNDFLNYGEENEIRVQVRNGAMTNSRWYSGGGIYRDVYLLVSDLTYMEPDGIQIKTESADEKYAVLKISATLKNRQPMPKDVTLKQVILDENGNKVTDGEAPLTLFEGETRTISQRLVVKQPNLWSAETPQLYTCISQLYQNEKMLDESVDTFGIRTLNVDARRGFRVNGQAVNLRGACIHHDNGLLGAATYEAAEYRRIKKLKAAGFNAVRMSHHPMAPAMLRACDQLGVYVMDEGFDMWNRCKSDYDYGLYFQEWWEKDVTAMVRKDYNHPSVIMYSVGNEIPEIGTPHGAKICHQIAEKIRKLDDSRYTLASINGIFAAGDATAKIMSDVAADAKESGEIEGNVNDFMTLMDQHLDKIVVHPAISARLERACMPTDIAGYNYMTARYEPDGKNYPNRVIVGSETYPPEIARNWDLVSRLNHVIGDFTWTGWDYIGEAGVGVPAYQWGEGGFGAGFPCQLAFAGDIDITGFRRPVSYFREIVFGLRTAPYIAVQDPNRYGQKLIKTPWVLSDSVSSWTWKGCEGKPVIVEIYAAGAEVELFKNGVSIGKKPSGHAAGFRTLFETKYECGELKAVSYDENGTVLGEMKIETAGDIHEIKAVLEPVQSNESELIYIPIEICDEKGNVVQDEVRKLSVQVTGASVAGFGSGNPKPRYNYTETITETYRGRALLILKRTGKQEKVNIEITSGEIKKII